MIQQQNMMQQQMMMIPPLLMIQQNLMNMNQQLNLNVMNRQKSIKKNIIFETTSGSRTNIIVEEGIALQELLNQYKNKVNFPIKYFIYSGNILEENDKRKVKDISLHNKNLFIKVVT